MAFIGIDLGTSGLRALLIDDNGQSIGSTSYNYPLTQPKTGWFEQNPADWITALESAMLELSVKYPKFAYVRGIGVTGHMISKICLCSWNWSNRSYAWCHSA